ncbi:hypothetical protein [Nonomuraea wenchangensis]|uniref:hypothetical protein n=1 Tax=Nonomuraea wenchangensis TaxID=568860 RepID=UPI0034228F94
MERGQRLLSNECRHDAAATAERCRTAHRTHLALAIHARASHAAAQLNHQDVEEQGDIAGEPPSISDLSCTAQAS